MYYNINHAQYSWRYYSSAEVLYSTLSHDFSHSDSWHVDWFKWMCVVTIVAMFAYFVRVFKSMLLNKF